MDKEELKELLCDVFSITEKKFSEGMTSDTLDEWDSLNHLRMISALEQEYDIKFSMDEVNSMLSFEGIVKMLEEHDQ